MALDKLALIEAFKAADKAARDAEPESDGGSCNFDQATITLPRVRATTINECAQAAGISVTKDYYDRPGRWLVNTYTRGQANKRTRMAEAASKAITAAGFDGGMYYRVD